MTALQRRMLLSICRQFQRLDYAGRGWVLARLAADHAELTAEERQAAA